MNNELQQALNCFLEAYQTAKEIDCVKILADFEDVAQNRGLGAVVATNGVRRISRRQRQTR